MNILEKLFNNLLTSLRLRDQAVKPPKATPKVKPKTKRGE